MNIFRRLIKKSYYQLLLPLTLALSTFCTPAISQGQEGPTLIDRQSCPPIRQRFKRYRLSTGCCTTASKEQIFGELRGKRLFPIDKRLARINRQLLRLELRMARNLKAAPTYRRSLLIGKQQQKQAEIQSWLDILQSSQKSCLPAAAGTPPLERPTPSSNRPQPPLPSGDPPIPLMDRWQSQMLSYGAKHCQALADPKLSFDTKLAAVYYDAQLVFYQIEDYTGDRNWRNCAARAQGIYRDRYVLPNRGAVPGYWNFGAGLAQSFLRHRDLRSREALLALAANAAYARQSTPTTETADALLSREVAYAIMSYLQAEATGAPRNPRLALLIEQSLGHLNQWFVAQSAPYLQPFMFGLSAQALIEYDERIGDSRILPALINGADRLWERTWVEEAQAFLYVDRPNVLADAMAPSADLNLLIAPLYAWLYRQTGQARFRERGDRIFAGGVAGAWLERGKQFNQNYRWSFAYIRWRTAIAD